METFGTYLLINNPMRLLAQDDYYYDTYVDDDEAVRQNQAFQFVVFVLYEMFLIFIFLSIDYLKIFDKPAKILGNHKPVLSLILN